jgi:hypothetical protein
VIQLRRAQIDERRHQHDVRCLLAQKASHLTAEGDRLLELRQHRSDQPPAGGRSDERQTRDAFDHARCAFFGSPSQARRQVVPGVEKTEVVDRQAQLPPEVGPRTRFAPWGPADGDAGISRGEPFHHGRATQGLLAIGGEVQRVTALRELGDGRLEVTQV